jgi:hypothetical protein
MGQRFEEVITSRERLRELNKRPSHLMSNKEVDHLDDICRRFIAATVRCADACRGYDRSRLVVCIDGKIEGVIED